MFNVIMSSPVNCCDSSVLVVILFFLFVICYFSDSEAHKTMKNVSHLNTESVRVGCHGCFDHVLMTALSNITVL